MLTNRVKFISGPLHNQECELRELPSCWIAPELPQRWYDRRGFRPITSPWDDLSAPVKLDYNEYQLYEQGGKFVYLWSGKYRADGSKLEPF